ncbi:replication protein [Providencia rettgeri]|uniref:replication protein n=1 Tax=Providencia TaxID=586 RepID=UPI001B38C787|nr:replication protein [Providencia rettgeri]ELR5161839.1 replication protein [Providencia rettgeri]MBQ0361300.1 replication protein [Providencia rettgeri]MBQ0664824.1 replication protein [Providencia rettgeri]MCB4826711.1 replication protein [Providencia rettgeri]MCG9945177.1 replication protein [Providencia rettgeri]
MTNTAEVFQFPAIQQETKRVADTDDGYTRIANELLESLSCCNLTVRQLRVMLAIIRKTYGFGKKVDRISDSQLADVSGLSRQNVNKAKKELISMNYLILEGNKIGVNKEVSAWKNQSRDSVSNLKTKNVSNLETNEVSRLETHKRNTLKKKETINTPISPKQKSEPKKQGFDPLAEPIPEWLNSTTWRNWIEYRKEIKKQIKTKQTFSGQIKLLTECYELGFSPEEIINKSITNGWQGLFKPKAPYQQANRITQPSRTQEFIPENF